MSKNISFIIKFLNRINKIIGKIIIFLSKFIKVDEINHLVDKPEDVKYRLFNVDEPAIIEPFVNLEHRDYKQLINDNNIKPIKRHNGKHITINVHCPCCNAPKDYLYDNNGKQRQFECKVCSNIFSINQKSVDDITKKGLTDNLKSLEDDGLITRKVISEKPLRVEYSLTETGLKLNPIIKELYSFGNYYKKKTI